ncbi:MAG: Fe-S cluster assembly protein SufD [Bdellovibrionaceae bacterium]|nr:Fe-S cluster assembly protein SufD [Pseudobdellovibrionaceae bacterium]
MNILSSFDHFLNEAKKNQSGVDWDAKRLAKESLSSKGLPSRKEESWRNTSLKFLSDVVFTPVSHMATALPEHIITLIQEKQIPGADVLVLANGFYIASLSKISESAVTVEMQQSPTSFQYHGDEGSEAIHWLNKIYNLHALEINITKDLTKPLQILNVAYVPTGAAVISSPRVQISLHANKEAKLVLTNMGEKNATYFANGHFAFTVAKDARLEIVNHVNQSANAYHFDFVGIRAEAASTVRYFELNMNGQLTRHEMVIELNGENIQSEILGASYLREKQHCDSQTFINHNHGHCRSEQIYKAVLDNEARSVFSGTVYIAPGIAKTDSAQLNQNLLLSDHAEVNSNPILRIFADDVKASHGSTIGQVSEDEIFYLQSRCINRTKAIELLGQGFLNEIIFKIGSDQLRAYFTAQVLREMHQPRKPQLKAVN